MGAKSNRKGGEFEIEICRTLSKWITGHRRPELFWRSATSGAKATMDHRAGRRSHMGGDIISVRPEGQWVTDAFSIECKFRKTLGVLPRFLLGSAEMLDWWAGACRDAEAQDKLPWLIFKQNGSPTYTAFPAEKRSLLVGTGIMTVAPPGLPSFRVGTLENVLEMNRWLVAIRGKRPFRYRPQRVPLQ